MKKLEDSSNYYSCWKRRRITTFIEDNLVNKTTIVIQSSAWNLNVLFYHKKEVREYNYPYTLPLEPTLVGEYQKRKLMEIYSELEILLENVRELDYIFCKGPGLSPSLASVKYLRNLLNKKIKINFYPIFHGLSHLAEVQINNPKKTYLFCYFSGGTTQFITRKNNSFNVISETLDITIGNLIDRRVSLTRYFCKAYFLEPTIKEVLSFIKETKIEAERLPAYFNLSGIEQKSKSWSYSKLLSFIVNLLKAKIERTNLTNIFFSGGVFNCETLRSCLTILICKKKKLYFEENNSDKAYMHLLNKNQNKISIGKLEYYPKIRIVNDYTPLRINQNKRINLKDNLRDFLDDFSERPTLAKRRIIYQLKYLSNQKICSSQLRKYLQVLSYRRHIPSNSK